MKGGTVVVEGRVGVGKTSFVNVEQYKIWKGIAKTPHFLPAFETVLLQEDMNPLTFMLSSLSNALYALMNIHGESSVKRNPVFRKILGTISQTVQTSVGVQATVAGFGGGVTRSAALAQPAALLMPMVLSHTDKFVSELHKLGYEGAIILVNNMDTLDEKFIVGFLSQIRDIALIRPGLIWVLIGREGLFSSLEKNMPRVSEIITGSPVVIKPPSKEDVRIAIERRTKVLRMRDDVKPIMEDEIIDVLYDVSNGEIRYIFKRATDIILQRLIQFPTERYVSKGAGLAILRDLAMKKIASLDLTKRETEVLSLMAKTEHFRVRDHASFSVSSPQAANKYVQKFMRLGLIVREELKKETGYKTTGDVNILYKAY